MNAMQLQHLTTNQLEVFYEKCRALESHYVTLPSAEIVRAPHSKEASYQQAHVELRDCLSAMPHAVVIELQALMWLGSGAPDSTFSAELDYSKTRFDQSSREYMATKSDLRQLVERGLSKSGVRLASK